MNSPRLKNLLESAAHCRVCPNTFRKYIVPLVPHVPGLGRCRRWDTRRLDAFLDLIQKAPETGDSDTEPSGDEWLALMRTDNDTR
jgi:hypothetical protein